MSLTELQDAILVRLIGKTEQTYIFCTYPDWLEKRMAQHRKWVRAQFRGETERTAAMKKIIHAQEYAQWEERKQDAKENAQRNQRVSAQAAGR